MNKPPMTVIRQLAARPGIQASHADQNASETSAGTGARSERRTRRAAGETVCASVTRLGRARKFSVNARPRRVMVAVAGPLAKIVGKAAPTRPTTVHSAGRRASACGPRRALRRMRTMPAARSAPSISVSGADPIGPIDSAGRSGNGSKLRGRSMLMPGSAVSGRMALAAALRNRLGSAIRAHTSVAAKSTRLPTMAMVASTGSSGESNTVPTTSTRNGSASVPRATPVAVLSTRASCWRSKASVRARSAVFTSTHAVSTGENSSGCSSADHVMTVTTARSVSSGGMSDQMTVRVVAPRPSVTSQQMPAMTRIVAALAAAWARAKPIVSRRRYATAAKTPADRACTPVSGGGVDWACRASSTANIATPRRPSTATSHAASQIGIPFARAATAAAAESGTASEARRLRRCPTVRRMAAAMKPRPRPRR